MGSHLSIQEEQKEQKTAGYVERLDYDTKNCLPGCIYKVDTERIDTIRQYALQKSSLWTNVVLLYCDKSSNHVLLRNRDISALIIRLLIEYSVQERIEKAPLLVKPWSILYINDDYYEIGPPSSCQYTDNAAIISMIICRGKRYLVSNYFWIDDIYHSLICDCPLLKESLVKRQREEWIRPRD